MKKEDLTQSSIEREMEQKRYKTPDYTQKERDYFGSMKTKLRTAQENRDKNHEEFDGLTYYDYYRANERFANTILEPTKNKGTKDFKSGTLRTKLNAYLSTITNLNLTGEINAFDKNNLPIKSLGRAIEDIIFRIDETSNDEEAKEMRQYELLKQGTVFIETLWEEKYSIQKNITKGGLGKIDTSWTKEFKKEKEEVSKRILSGLSVYLGNINQYDINKQPYIYTVEVIDYDIAKQLYGTWDRWGSVTTDEQFFSGENQLGSPWRLIDDSNTKNKVEVIKYQSLPDNEYQVILNGIPMLPVGFPIPWGFNRYSIVQQNLEPIAFNFAYGKSFIFNNKNLVQVLDEMLKLSVLKTNKSFQPARINQTGKRITPDMFLPGKMVEGILKGQVPLVDDNDAIGVTNAEFAMIGQIKGFVDANTVSQTYAGAQEEGGSVTATQIIELQRQAKIMMGITILACTLLEKKLTENMLDIVLDKWFEPLDTKLDETRKIIKNTYRQITRERNLGSAGKGLSIVGVAEENVPGESIREAEDNLQKRYGFPVRISIINKKELDTRKVFFYVVVTAKDKNTSEMQKIMLIDMFKVLIGFGLPVNTDYMSEVLGEAYEMDGNKLFTKTQPTPKIQEGVSGNAQGATPDTSNIAPNVSANLQASAEK